MLASVAAELGAVVLTRNPTDFVGTWDIVSVIGI
jgi:hypothetical protein